MCGESRVYLEHGRYLVDDPPLEDAALAEYERVVKETLRWMPPKLFASDEAVVEGLKKNGVDDPVLLYYVSRELLGYGVLQPLIDDDEVEDVVIASPGTPVSVRHRTGNLRTNMVLTEEEVDSLAQTLAAKAGKPISTYQPLLSTRLPEGHRLTMNYGDEVSHRGTSIAIRKFPSKPWSVTQLITYSTAPPEVLAWLWILVENRKALLVTGTSGSGKTSMINALTSFIPRNARVVTVEDAGELRLTHEFWTPLVARYSYTQDRAAEITLDALVRHALRMSADYIIVGEVRGDEGRTWAQSILTGHGGLTSVHSETPELAVQRLVSPPILVEERSLSSLHCILELRAAGQRRYVSAVLDHGYTPESGHSYRRLFRASQFSSELADEFEFVSSPTVQSMVDQGDFTEKELLQEYRARKSLLQALYVESQIDYSLMDHAKMTELAWAYQSNPALKDKPESLIRSLQDKACSICGSELKEAGEDRCESCLAKTEPEAVAG